MLEELKEEQIVNKVGGRFKLSTLIQKRMIALNQGSRPMVDPRGLDKMTVVIREIQTVHQAQTQYMSQFGKYATTLAELGPPASGGPGPQAADLIPNSLASGEKDGYVFTLTATPNGYTVNANPKVYNSTGRCTFYSDQGMQIHQNWSQEPANATSPELK